MTTTKKSVYIISIYKKNFFLTYNSYDVLMSFVLAFNALRSANRKKGTHIHSHSYSHTYITVLLRPPVRNRVSVKEIFRGRERDPRKSRYGVYIIIHCLAKYIVSLRSAHRNSRLAKFILSLRSAHR